MTLEVLRVVQSIPRIGNGEASDAGNLVPISDSEDRESSSEQSH